MMRHTADKNDAKSGTFAMFVPLQHRNDAPQRLPEDPELLALVDDPELCAAMLADPELRELAELTRLADQLRASFAPRRTLLDSSEQERVQRIQSAVLKRSGVMPPETALLDEAAQDHLLARKLAEYRSACKRRLSRLLSARFRGSGMGHKCQKG
jgi:hypothetical protein